MSATNATPVITLEQRRNLLYIHCPTVIVLNEMKRFLTFIRPVREETKYGKPIWTQQQELCYQVLDDPFILSCSAGFLYSLVEAFNDRYDLKISRTMCKRVRENTQPDWSQLDSSVVFRPKQREVLEKMIAADRGRIISSSYHRTLHLI